MSYRRSEEGPLVSGPSVELPGIETGTKVALTCGNGQSDDAKYAKRRENTCGDAESLMASTRRSPYTLALDAVLPIRVSAPSVGNTCYFSDAVSRTARPS